jgi:hypothetical protein
VNSRAPPALCSPQYSLPARARLFQVCVTLRPAQKNAGRMLRTFARLYIPQPPAEEMQMDSTPTLRPGQPKPPTPPTPFFRSGEVYLLADLCRVFSRRTVKSWEATGLRIIRPGTRHAFILSDDLLELLRQWTPPPRD